MYTRCDPIESNPLHSRDINKTISETDLKYVYWWWWGYLRAKQVCFLNCRKPSTQRQAPSRQLLFATLNEHCSGNMQSLPRSCAEMEFTYEKHYDVGRPGGVGHAWWWYVGLVQSHSLFILNISSTFLSVLFKFIPILIFFSFLIIFGLLLGLLGDRLGRP